MTLIIMGCLKIRKKFVDKCVKRTYNIYSIPARPLLSKPKCGGFFFFGGK